MFVILTLLIIIPLICFLLNKNHKIKRNVIINSKYNSSVCLVCFCLIWLLYISINSNFSDLEAYTNAIKEVRNCSWKYLVDNNIPNLKAEIGYRFYCKIFSVFTVNSKIFQACTGLIIIAGYYKVIRTYSPMVLLSLLLFVVGPFFQSLYVLRQYMTLSLILLSYPYVINRNFWKFLIIISIAFTIHQSAIVFFPIYYLYGIKNNKYLIIIIIISSLLIFSLLSFLIHYYAEVLAFASAGYGDGYMESEQGANFSVPLLLLGILIFRIFILRKKFWDSGINKLLSIILIFGCVFSFAGIGIVATSRLFMCYTSVLFIIIPNTLSYICNSSIRNSIAILLLGVSFVPFMSIVASHSHESLF